MLSIYSLSQEVLKEEGWIMDKQTLIERIRKIESKREVLVDLMEQPNMGNLRLDVNQALEELDDLLEEFKETFPEAQSN